MRAEAFDKFRALVAAGESYTSAVDDGASGTVIDNAMCAALSALCEFTRANRRIRL